MEIAFGNKVFGDAVDLSVCSIDLFQKHCLSNRFFSIKKVDLPNLVFTEKDHRFYNSVVYATKIGLFFSFLLFNIYNPIVFTFRCHGIYLALITTFYYLCYQLNYFATMHIYKMSSLRHRIKVYNRDVDTINKCFDVLVNHKEDLSSNTVQNLEGCIETLSLLWSVYLPQAVPFVENIIVRLEKEIKGLTSINKHKGEDYLDKVGFSANHCLKQIYFYSRYEKPIYTRWVKLHPRRKWLELLLIGLFLFYRKICFVSYILYIFTFVKLLVNLLYFYSFNCVHKHIVKYDKLVLQNIVCHEEQFEKRASLNFYYIYLLHSKYRLYRSLGVDYNNIPRTDFVFTEKEFTPDSVGSIF